MTPVRRLAHTALLVTLFLPGCGYFNTMYNANRAFSDAEKAAARGDRATAETAYRLSIEKAGKSIARRPDSRWSDDARLLIARAHYALGDYQAARLALLELLQLGSDARERAAAELYLGLVEAAVGDDAAALARLDRSLSEAAAPEELLALARVTRARIHYRQGNYAAAGGDLDALAADAERDVRLAALVLDLRIATQMADSGRARRAFAALLGDANGATRRDSLRRIATAAAPVFGHNTLRSFLAPAATSPWPAPARDSVLLYRAELALLAGDTAAAIADAQSLSQRATGAAVDHARLKAAEWQLAQATGVEDLQDARATLLAALGSQRGRMLIQSIKMVEVMLEKASSTGQPLQIFAAAEVARDDLEAPRLAVRLFLTYAEVAPQTEWAAKALLAALALETGEAAMQLRQRVESLPPNPYLAAVHGHGDAEAFARAEERLARGIQAARAEALAEAARRDNVVGRAILLIDSIRSAALTDSTRVRCGILVDSLAVVGIRADSIRAACQRDDRSRITLLLEADTLLLRDSTKAKADSVKRSRVRRDTTHRR